MSLNPIIFLIYDLPLSKNLFLYKTTDCSAPNPLPYLLKPPNSLFTLVIPPFNLLCRVTPSKTAFVICYIPPLKDQNQLMEGFIKAFEAEAAQGDFGFKGKRSLEGYLKWVIEEKKSELTAFDKVNEEIDQISIKMKENISKIAIRETVLKDIEKKTEVLMANASHFQKGGQQLAEQTNQNCTKGFGFLMGGLTIAIFIILMIIITYYN